MTPGGSRIEDLARSWLEPPRPAARRERRQAMARRGGALVVAGIVGVLLVRPVVRGHVAPLPPPPSSGGDVRFGLALTARHKIFAEVARAQHEAQDRGRADYPDDPWSQQDDTAAVQRDTVRDVAARHKVTLTQAYLVLDEGIRGRWPVPHWRPLDGAIVPLHPRRTW